VWRLVVLFLCLAGCRTASTKIADWPELTVALAPDDGDAVEEATTLDEPVMAESPEAPTKLNETDREKMRIEVKKDLQKELAASTPDPRLGGFNFGIAFTGTFDLGGRDRVKRVELDPNGIVRVTQEDNVRGRIMLEAHYFFPPGHRFLGINHVDWGWGPFLAILPGSSNVIDAMGAGLMIGWKYNKSESERATKAAIEGKDKAPSVPDWSKPGTSFNFGIGAVVDFDAVVLGDGVEDGQPLPPGETTIRTVTTDQTGLLVMFSFTWTF